MVVDTGPDDGRRSVIECATGIVGAIEVVVEINDKAVVGDRRSRSPRAVP